MTVNSTAVVAGAGQSIAFSNLVTVSGPNNPTYLLVSGLDRNEYTASSNGNQGSVSGSGQTIGFQAEGGDASGFGLLFTYNGVSGHYVNAQFGALDALVMTASTDTDRNEALSFYGSNDLTLLPRYAADSVGLLQAGVSNYLGTVDVLTEPSLAGHAALQATPDAVATAARRFVGQTWNANGCWGLACAITAEAGASLPAVSTLIDTPGQANGLWMVAYNGPAGDTGDWRAMLTTGDVIVFKTGAGEGHVATVVSGSGASAMVIDNAEYLTAAGTIANAVADGAPSDIAVAPAHAAQAEFTGVSDDDVVIDRLDTPVVTAGGPVFLRSGAAKLLGSLASAADPAGKAIVSYQVYDTTAQDQINVGGVAQTASSAAHALTLSAAAFQTASLQAPAGASAPTTGTLAVRAFNGTAWGDWATVSVTATPSAVTLTAAAAAAAIGTLAAAVTAGTVTTISLTDAGLPTLTLTAALLAADRAAIERITGRYILCVTGTSQDGVITGSNGINSLSAGIAGGNHVINAGAGLGGADTLMGGLGSDMLNGSTNAAGRALLLAGAGRNILNGGRGADTLVGGGHSSLNAGASGQMLLGGYTNASSDTLNGGAASHEFLAVAAGNNLLNAGAGTGNVLEGGKGADRINGSTSAGGASVMIGGSGANVLDGGLGADTLVGGGSSVLNAGTGAGQLLLGGYSAAAHDVLNAGAASAVLAVATGNNILHAGTGQSLLLGGAGGDMLVGGGGQGTLIGGSGHSTLIGGAGGDVLVGTGQSLLVGGSGTAGTSLLLGGFSPTAHDTLLAGTGSGETLAVARGNNQLQADQTGAGSNDTLIAGAGNDTLYGAAYGNATPSGPVGPTIYVVSDGRTSVAGGAGNDLVFVAGKGSLTFDGGSGGIDIVDFAGHAAKDATFTTNGAGATLISFANTAQTATLTHVGSVMFGLDGTTHTLS